MAVGKDSFSYSVARMLLPLSIITEIGLRIIIHESPEHAGNFSEIETQT